MAKSRSKPFWVFTDSNGMDSLHGSKKRLAVDLKGNYDLLDQIKRKTGRVPRAPNDLVGRANQPHFLQDVPCVYMSVKIVSDRVRAVFEAAGPGDCQFIPLDVRFGRRSLGRYWLLHVNRTIDCADYAASYNVNKPGEKPFFIRTAIIPERVPEHVSTFRVKHGPHFVIIRNSLRLELIKAKVTGCEFASP